MVLLWTFVFWFRIHIMLILLYLGLVYSVLCVPHYYVLLAEVGHHSVHLFIILISQLTFWCSTNPKNHFKNIFLDQSSICYCSLWIGNITKCISYPIHKLVDQLLISIDQSDMFHRLHFSLIYSYPTESLL